MMPCILHTSLYTDDAEVFMSHFKGNNHNLSKLCLFRDITSLSTNFQKSSVVPIGFDHINLPHVLYNLSMVPTSFPIKCLGLPLSVWQLTIVDFQFLEDKGGG